MSAEIVQFPSRAQAHARAKPSAMKHFDRLTDRWCVDVWSASGDSSARLGTFLFENEADRCIDRWRAEHGLDPDPRGAA